MTEDDAVSGTGVKMTASRADVGAPNSPSYWDWRFRSGHWEEGGGRAQTRAFAAGQVPHFGIPADFDGSILDFGCGLGDAMPVYRRAFPKARLAGIDISPGAISRCTERYGYIATFQAGDHLAVPRSDVIIRSNVFEHLEDYREVARTLLGKCHDLYVIVPYREVIVPGGEHLHSFDRSSFDGLSVQRTVVFHCAGWTEYGFRDQWWELHGKNVLRTLTGRPRKRRGQQIMYHLRSA